MLLVVLTVLTIDLKPFVLDAVQFVLKVYPGTGCVTDCTGDQKALKITDQKTAGHSDGWGREVKRRCGLNTDRMLGWLICRAAASSEKLVLYLTKQTEEEKDKRGRCSRGFESQNQLSVSKDHSNVKKSRHLNRFVSVFSAFTVPPFHSVSTPGKDSWLQIQHLCPSQSASLSTVAATCYR